MGLISGVKAWANGDLGGVRCRECGHSATGQKANKWARNQEGVSLGRNYPVCPECGSEKTTSGLLIGLLERK